ncbi:MAG: enoyl-CoA hydratase [Acidimicrobiales bacterium]|nr:enoyl-CoA hydratase [Acidimicrobiales bacterium]
MAITAERRGAVAVITIDRQERRNALDVEAATALADEVGRAVDDGCRVAVITGAGGHFCAGADLTGVEDASFLTALRRLLRGVRDAPLPVIAAVEGAALGAGTQVAIACDLRVAAPDATFGIPAAKLGLMVDQWTVARLAALAGTGPASAMLLAAEVVSGADAVRLGLAQRSGRLDDALAWADDIAALAPLTIAGHKLALNRNEPQSPEDPDVAAAFGAAWSSADLAEGMAAFRERRPPQFEGR